MASAAGTPWDDGRRVGKALQQGAAYWSSVGCSSLCWMEAQRLVGCNGSYVGESFAEHAQPYRSGAIPWCGSLGVYESVRGSRYRYAFEVIGASWLDGRRLAAELNARRLRGVSFIPIRFTPRASKFQKEPCGGINI